jgi:hypothetical protein
LLRGCLVIDTLGLRYQLGEAIGSAELAAFSRICPAGVVESARIREGDRAAQDWRGEAPGLGLVQLRADGRLFLTRSLSKVYQELIEGVASKECDNGRVLTSKQASEGWKVWEQHLCGLLPVDPESCHVQRADVVFDRMVGDSCGVLRALEGAIKPTRKGAAWFDNGAGIATGLMLRGVRVVHRVYDKGLESGSSVYRGVLRSEEQLRTGSRGLERILELESRSFCREEAVQVLNERYLEAVREVISAGGTTSSCVNRSDR